MSYAYEGVKFQTVFDARRAPDDDGLGVLRRWCRVFHEKSLAPPYDGGSYGNLSFRAGNAFVITGSRMGLKDNPGPDSFVKVLDVDMDKTTIRVQGLREPSSETMLHHAIYARRPDVNAIFHGHSPEILSGASRMRIPQTARPTPYGTREMVESVLEILEDTDFLIIRDHGFVGMGHDMDSAGDLCLARLEECLRAAGKAPGR